ncbi:MAG: hypothetical protein M0015_05900 [Betaproteobacteria bacterium]|nr:hypothetical protein [Betaproteobacteria bacterium]
MERPSFAEVKLSELVQPPKLLEDPEIAQHFASEGSIEWELRTHKREYISAGALFEVARRLLVHPARFKATALEIAARKLAVRAGIEV